MRIVRLNTAVVGSGAAGLNAAVRLKQFGVDDVAVITEGFCMGTSRNTGSDKQTYYKLGIGGETPDSPYQMARDLFDGGCVDGDNALVEAAMSLRSFMHLCEIGLPFPTNSYGEYVGYKTDHDPCARATSVGPLTSKLMTEALADEASRRGVTVYDRHLVVSLVKNGEEIAGLIALNLDTEDFVLFSCKNVIYATGGPAGMYADSVYPYSQTGASGVLFEAGVRGQNLTEWQYGLASTAPRWNVSGTYMQVLPTFVSVDADGGEHDFLGEYFGDESKCLSMIFLKGYQWPFDSRKVLDGSSVIDLLVWYECVVKGRRVYLDFRTNPFGHEVNFSALETDCYTYLARAGATFGTPIERLKHMNQPAVDFYASRGVDLSAERLEIALCAQHSNGGVAVDAHWESSVAGLFAVGEVAGTHGIYRPGGSALNAGQVGSLAAAEYISCARRGVAMGEADILALAEPMLKKLSDTKASLVVNEDNVDACIQNARRRMTAAASAIRSTQAIEEALSVTAAHMKAFDGEVGVGKNGKKLGDAFRLRDTLISQYVYLTAMREYAKKYATRGSSLYYDPNGVLREGLEECFRFTLDDGGSRDTVQEVQYTPCGCEVTYRPVRPIPEADSFFENVWRAYRERHGV